MSIDDVYSVVFYGAGFVALCLWIWFWGRWKKRHPNQGLDQVLWQRARNAADQVGADDWLKQNWTSVAIVSGVILVVLGLSGWTPAGAFTVGGFSGRDQGALVVGAALIAVGWLGRPRQ